MNNKVLVGMSGGVDSSAAVKVLCDMGYSVGGVTLILCGEDNKKNIEDAQNVCEKLNIPHFVKDLSDEFKSKVIADFISEYKIGNTPNPCIVCNREIKFGQMLNYALSLGYDKIATGHYARIKKENGRFLLYKGADESKDQSYVLCNLTQEQLSHILFPLGDYNKSQIRKIAVDAGLINANRPDSQDICFVPDGDYASFIEKTDNYKSIEGNFVDINGNILGIHKGVINYTIGQRKGLGIALGKPAFVIDKNADTNTVTIGDEEHLFKKEVLVKNCNFIPFDELDEKISVSAKLRYRHNPSKAIIEPMEDRKVRIIFDEPQRAPSAGQAAVFYKDDLVIGGGTII